MAKRANDSELAEFGDRLRALREDLGWTQAEVAARLGITDGGYGHFERGRRLPSAAEMPWLARGLGVSTEELLTRLRIVDQQMMSEPLPAALEDRFHRIAARWPHLTEHDRATVDQILGVVSNLGPPDVDMVKHQDSEDTQNATTDVVSIISRLDPSSATSATPAPTRELALAGR